jgi:hypothetical protein
MGDPLLNYQGVSTFMPGHLITYIVLQNNKLILTYPPVTFTWDMWFEIMADIYRGLCWILVGFILLPGTKLDRGCRRYYLAACSNPIFTL